MIPVPGRDDPVGAVGAVVLAGGTSRRFGSDKLAAPWAGTSLLDHVIGTLPPSWTVVVVGPPRALSRTVRFVREDPPGSGPAAGLSAGVRTVGTPRVVTLPGDSPYAAQVATLLLAALDAEPSERVASVAADGNPLFLALRDSAITALRDPTRDDAGRSARALVAELGARPVPVPAELLLDVDTPADL